jgi:hypothetical protein
MESLSFEISDEILDLLRRHPEIKWEDIARKAVEDFAKKLDLIDNLLSESEFSELDAEELSEMVKESAWKKLSKK